MQGRRELGTRNGGLDERFFGGIDRVYRQYILASVRAGLQAPAVAGEIEEDGGVAIGAMRQCGQSLAQRGFRGLSIPQQLDVVQRIATLV